MDHHEFRLRYKGNVCTYCGKSVVESFQRHGTFRRLFHFNHINPAKKDPDYDNLIRQNVSTKQLDELDKCILMCANCHAVIHAQNINGKLTLRIHVEGQTAEQTFTGQVIVDKMDKRLSFFSDEEILIAPYWVAIGNDAPQLVFGADLKSGLMQKYVPLTKERNCLGVTNQKGKMVFAANRVDEKCVHVQQHSSFSLLHVQIDPDPLTTVWIRNGLAIVRSGKDMKVDNDSLFTAEFYYGDIETNAQNPPSWGGEVTALSF